VQVHGGAYCYVPPLTWLCASEWRNIALCSSMDLYVCMYKLPSLCTISIYVSSYSYMCACPRYLLCYYNIADFTMVSCKSVEEHTAMFLHTYIFASQWRNIALCSSTHLHFIKYNINALLSTLLLLPPFTTAIVNVVNIVKCEL
jgi:hypothetical protein